MLECDLQVSFAGDAFGILEVLTPRSRRRVKGQALPATSYVVLPDRVHAIPGKGVLQGLLAAHLRGFGVAGDVAAQFLTAEDFYRWTPPPTLAAAALELASPGGDTNAFAPAVSAAFRAAAEVMAAEIDVARLCDVARDALGIPASGPAFRVITDKYELGSDIGAAAEHAIGRFGTSWSLGPSPEEIARWLGLVLVQLPQATDERAYLADVEEPVVNWEPPTDRNTSRFGSRYGIVHDVLVRPEYVASDSLVVTLGLRAGLPVVLSGDTKDLELVRPLPEIYLAAEEVIPLPELRAVLAPRLRLVCETDGKGTEGARGERTLAQVQEPVLAFDAPVEKHRPTAWSPRLRDAVRAARAEVAGATAGMPLAILPWSLADVPGYVGSSRAVLWYATRLGSEDSLLPWWESAAATPVPWNPSHLRVDLTEYQRELAAEMLRVTRPDLVDPISEVAARFRRLASEVEALVAPAVAEAAALHCPESVLSVVRGPLVGLVSALRSTTPARLRSQTRAGEIAVAAVVTSCLASEAAPDVAPEVAPAVDPASAHRSQGDAAP